jgi:glycosyltransferase involved in cell wall biosynthesis
MRGPSRHYHFLRELSRRHTISLVSLTRAPMTAEAMGEIGSYTEHVATFGTHAASPARGVRRLTKLLGPTIHNEFEVQRAVHEMKRAVHELLRRQPFDVVLFHGKHLYPVVEDLHLPVVVDFCDATSTRIETKMQYAPLWYRPLLSLRLQQVRGLENRLMLKSHSPAFISPRDRKAVVAQGRPAAVIPNGVDQRYWRRSSNAKPSDQCIIFTGVMDYAPNHDAALYLIDEIVPLVRRAVPDLEVLIVGRDPSQQLKARAGAVPGVNVTGFVEDMRPWLERAAVCVAPVRYASGMQNKVLEALAMQVPVVATPVVSDGVRMDDAPAPLCTARDPLEFAENTVRLLRNAHERRRLAMDGRRFVEKHFSWRRSAAMLEQMCLAAAGLDKDFLRHRRDSEFREVA